MAGVSSIIDSITNSADKTSGNIHQAFDAVQEQNATRFSNRMKTREIDMLDRQQRWNEKLLQQRYVADQQKIDWQNSLKRSLARGVFNG